MKHNSYEYYKQLRKYILQFMAIFEGLEVSVGQRTNHPAGLIPVTIKYGHADRVVSSILAGNTQNAPLRLPTMSANFAGLAIAVDRMKGVGGERRSVHVPMGGTIPEDVQVIHQLMPVPYELTMDLHIFTSNTNQQMQILEQLLPMFDPQLLIQTSDTHFDWTRLTCVTLTNIALDNNYPSGSDPRLNQVTITFTIPIYIGVSANIKRDFIERVKMRIGMIDTANDGMDIVADFDSQEIPYDIIQDVSNLPIS
jgi:hypothetical protein